VQLGRLRRVVGCDVARSAVGRTRGGAAGGGGRQAVTAVNLNTDGVSPGGANTSDVVAAATAFLGTLDSTQTGKVVYDFSNNAARQTWSNVPSRVVPRSGMAMSDLSASQRSAVDAMLHVALAPAGAPQDADIRNADDYRSRRTRGRRRRSPPARSTTW